MAKLTFENLKFEKTDNGIRVWLLGIFYFDIDTNAKVKENTIDFPGLSEKKATNKFNQLLTKNISNLKNSLNGNHAVYVHKNSGIPLIGTHYLGIVDRNTNILEIKTITGCNLNCIFCSVDEGLTSKKKTDFVVEEEYLVSEIKKLIKYKECDDIEIHINTHGEPFLYEDYVQLVKDLSKIKEIKRISTDTNTTLLTKKKIDELIKAGMTCFNFTIHGFDDKITKKMAGTAKYDVKHVKEIIEYTAKKCKVIIAPIWLPTYNDSEIEKLVLFAKKIKADIGIQKFLSYKKGRNPVKQMEWDEFYKKLKQLQEKHKIQLIKTPEDFHVKDTKKLKKPFNKGDFLEAVIVSPGRYKNEKLAAAKGRCISVFDCDAKIGKKVKLKITGSKHNIFFGRVM